jgi:polyferredoxin
MKSRTSGFPISKSAGKFLSVSLIAIGFLILLLHGLFIQILKPEISLCLFLVLLCTGTLLYVFFQYQGTLPGIKNNGIWFDSLTARGTFAWSLGLVLTGFYIVLYWFPEWLGTGKDGMANSGLVALFDPLSFMIKNKPASQWFVYGTLYTLAIVLTGIKFIVKYRHNRYQVYRTLSVMFFQTCFAFIIPEILLSLHLPYYDFKNIWPLNYYFFFDWNLDAMMAAGTLGYFMLFWGIVSFAVITPVLTYFYGKRWYCSWVCGCGGLAETAGDAFRHLSDTSLKAWKTERWMIHGILVFVVVMTIAVLVTRFTGIQNVFIINSAFLSHWYGFLIGAAFSGVIGVGFYPILGSRVWCRFGCPMAAYMGLMQRTFIRLPWKKEAVRLSTFRVTTNGGQCISCGNCSVYCEMGIDVKAYAQRQEDIIRASCVGCGICSAVCPRGVLRLENL